MRVFNSLRSFAGTSFDGLVIRAAVLSPQGFYSSVGISSKSESESSDDDDDAAACELLLEDGRRVDSSPATGVHDRDLFLCCWCSVVLLLLLALLLLSPCSSPW